MVTLVASHILSHESNFFNFILLTAIDFFLKLKLLCLLYLLLPLILDCFKISILGRIVHP
jgi:hypothetical protein